MKKAHRELYSGGVGLSRRTLNVAVRRRLDDFGRVLRLVARRREHVLKEGTDATIGLVLGKLEGGDGLSQGVPGGTSCASIGRGLGLGLLNGSLGAGES